MRIPNWGNSLALRLPARLIQKLSLRLDVSRKPNPQEIIEPLRKFSSRLPDNYRFDRDEANAR